MSFLTDTILYSCLSYIFVSLYAWVPKKLELKYLNDSDL